MEEAVETSYQKGGEKACMTEDVASKQTVKNTIHELEVELEEEIFMRYLPISYKR